MEEAVTPGPAAVIGRIEGELRALWAAPPAPGEVPRSRACTMNLVLVASSVDVAREWVPVVDEVLQGTPARALVVGLDPDGPDALEADVSGVCAAGGAGALMCSERVALVARGAVSVRLPSVVGALTVTDVPTTLVWLGRVHANDPVFAALAADATRIVLDASRGSLAGLADVVYWLRTRAPAVRPGVADLTWVRLAPWQELCARLFDEPRLRPLAERVTAVSIVQDAREGSVLGPQGTLLLGWLATRLGWKATSLAGKLRLVRRDGATIGVSLRAQAAAGGNDPPSLRAVSLDAASGDLGVHGEIVREGDASPARDEATPARDETACWRTEIRSGSSEPQRIEQRVRLRDEASAALLDRTLHRPTHDPALEEAAAWVDELRGEELACG
jgi:glucose-6-phosphate dehydrogenase assembly protein OpcA